MDIRETFVRGQISDKKSRILELGPLNRPIVQKKDFPNSRYCDIRNTEDIKALYSGNAYLESTGIWVDTSTIVEIDDVIHGSYSDFYADQEKFDVVIASHVLEHMDDLIFSLRDIAGILKPGGLFCIVYPDKRYCFDHFRQSATFREAYQVYTGGITNNAPRVLDFFLSSVAENNAARFWNEKNLLDLLPNEDIGKAVQLYQEACTGQRMADVHYWPFTDWDFLLFLRECTRMGLLPYRCVDFLPTQENDQQFFLALRMDPTVPDAPDEALHDLKNALSKALPHFYSSKERKMQVQLLENEQQLAQQAQSLTAKDVQLTQQAESLAAKDVQLTQQAESLAAKDVQLAQLAEKTIEKDMQFAQEVSRKGNEIQTLQEYTRKQEKRAAESEMHCQQLQSENLFQAQELQRCSEELEMRISRITQLETIENSTIWRMSAPLRHFLDAIKRTK